MGTATAPLAGHTRRERLTSLREFVRRATTPCIAGKRGSIERRALWRFAVVIPVSNLCGAIDVFLFSWFVLPLPHVDAHVRVVNSIAFGAVMLITFGACAWRSNSISEPIARWLDSGEPADEEIAKRVLRNPWQQTLISAQAWLFGAVVFGVLNSFYSVELGALVFVAIVLGGVTTCGLMYLLADKALHPITVRALSSAVPREPAVPGVDARVLVTFAFTTAGPLLSMAALGIAMLSGATVAPHKLAMTLAALGIWSFIAGLMGMKLVARSVAAPLRSMRRAIARVESGEFDAEVRVYDGSEVGVLQAGFNSMVAGLREREQLRDLFGRHVGEHVAVTALERGAKLGGELRQAAVMFVDVIGSTSLAAERAPDDVVNVLNDFFGLVVDVTREHGGWVNKFEGDGALCVFGAPDDLADPAGSALAAARDLDARMRRELPELQAGIGVSAGTVVAGNVGAAERFEYTVIGDPVNEASRLVGLAKETQGRVLASAATLARAHLGERQQWQADGEAQLRGRPRPTKLVVPVRADEIVRRIA